MIMWQLGDCLSTLAAFVQTFEDARVNEAVTGIRGTVQHFAVRQQQLRSAKVTSVDNDHARIYLHACNARGVALSTEVTLLLELLHYSSQ